MSHIDFEFSEEQKRWFTKEADSHEFEVRIQVPSRHSVTEEIYNHVVGTFKHDTSYRVTEKEYTNINYSVAHSSLQQLIATAYPNLSTDADFEREKERLGKGYLPVLGHREYRHELISSYTVDGVPQRVTDRFMSKSKVIAIDKQKEIKRDIDFLGFVVRISESKEEDIQALPPNAVESFRRMMKRTSFSKENPGGGRVVFDFSIVTNRNSRTGVEEKTYELELEYMPLDRTLFYDEMRPYLFMLLGRVVKPTLPPISSVVFFQKSTLERRMVELEDRMRHPFNGKLRGLAINIKHSNFEHMAKYALTNKLDGERKMVYVTPNYIYILHPHGVSPNGARNDIFLAVPVSQEIERLPHMMLDCEYANGMLHMFDVLYYEGQFGPLDKVYHEQRMASVTQSLHDIIPFTKKPFYYASNMEEKLHAFMTEHTDPHTFFKQNDGFIFTYKECSYIETNQRFPNLKYKFSSKLSLDFFIHKIPIPDPQFPYCYNLFSDAKHLDAWSKHAKRLTTCSSQNLARIAVNYIAKRDEQGEYNDLVYGFYIRLSHPSCPINKNDVFSTTDLGRTRVILSHWPDLNGILRSMDTRILSLFMKEVTELHQAHPYSLLKRVDALVNHSIVECLFVKNTFLYLRSRPDRVVGNRYDVVQDVVKDMINPISLTQMFPITHEWWKTYLFKLEEDNKSFVLEESVDTSLSTLYHILPDMIPSVMSYLHLTEPYKYLYPPENTAVAAQRTYDMSEQAKQFNKDFTSILIKSTHLTNFQWLWKMSKQWTLRMVRDVFVNVYTSRELAEFEKISPNTVDTPWFDVRRFDLYKNNHICVSKHGYATPSVSQPLPPLNRDVRLYSFAEHITDADSKYSVFKTIGETSDYSSLKPWEERQLTRIYREWFHYPDDIKTIVDATAHIGIDTIHWADLFHSCRIHAFEINPVAYVALEHNISSSIHTERIIPHYADSTEWIPTEPIDILYLDPPWGGPQYKKEKCLELYVQKEQKENDTPNPSKNVNYIIDRWMSTDLVKTIILKAPSNFNQSYLFRRYKVDTELVLNKNQSDISYYVLRITKTESILYKPFSQLTLWTIPYITESYEPIFFNTNMVLVKMPGDIILDSLNMSVSYFLYTPFSYKPPRLIKQDELTECARKMGFVYKKGVIIDKGVYGLFVKEGVSDDESETLKEVKQYHNIEKRALITQFCKKKIVLDLGAGFGGDLIKYNEINVRHLFLVEPNERNILQLKKRITSMVKLDKKSTLILARGQDTNIISKKIAPHRMEVVSSFFSLTFLFESDSILGKFLDTVSASVTEGGYFIGTMMSGEKTYDVLKDKPNGDSTVLVTNKVNGNELVTIHKEYDDLKEGDMPRTGMKLRIGISDSIVGEDQTEYLAFFSILSLELEKRHFKRVEYIEFRPPVDKIIHDDERAFSALNIGFAFRYLPPVIPYATHPLPTDQTFEYNNLYKESQLLVRTGVPKELSFYHAYLYNTSVSYREGSSSARQQAAHELSELHPHVTLDTLPSFIKSVDKNIYVIDSKTRRPINLDKVLPDGTKQKAYNVMRDWSIIITVIGTHFEPVAVNKDGTAIRIFEKYEPVLAKIHHEMRKSESQ